MSYTKEDLLQHLENIGVNPTGTLKVHLSCKAIGEVQGGADTILNGLMTYMKAGLLVLPTHTWNNVKEGHNPVMDVLHTPSCVGILTELFRKRAGVYRSFHPTHSVAAFGKDAKTFVDGEERMNRFQTPCGPEGAYYKLWERDAQILLVGVNFTRNTFIHGIEEWDGGSAHTISTTKSDLYVITPEGKRLYTPQYRHCAPIGSDTFTKLEPQALQERILTLGKFGDATTRLMNAKPLRTMVAGVLKQDPNYLLGH